jgi:hypothetical protein
LRDTLAPESKLSNEAGGDAVSMRHSFGLWEHQR